MSDPVSQDQNRDGEPDADLVQAFDTLRSEDAQRAPEFSVPELDTGERRPGWRLRPAIPLAMLAVVLALTSLEFFRSDPEDDGRHVAAPAPASADDTIQFDKLSALVSRELFVAAVDDWTAPSDYLLEPIDP